MNNIKQDSEDKIKQEKPKLKISVRDLVAFVLSSGDLESGFIGPGRGLEGARVHVKIQKRFHKYEFHILF